ncbi:uncharacterized protein isoform X2 [Rhodnius prolixus]|uniref:uncharacterized protein isoform X2 n=1 Tax=Rhodnius prolixus TaxID=13249 RepID=UPI003D18CAFB
MFLYKYILLINWLASCTSQMSCPIPWWYCLNRDPRDNSQVSAVDSSNRSIKWNWDSGGGRWDVSYFHSFPTWDMAYNGDVFGFEPGSNGQYTFHIYSRKLKYNPFTIVPTQPPPIPIPTPVKNRCPLVAEERAQGTFWWLDRKSSGKCAVTVSRPDLGSPVYWEWQTDKGRWRVQYSWAPGVTNCSIYYTQDNQWAQNMQIISWSYLSQQLVITYTALTVKINDEGEWKLHVNDGETWGFTPVDDQWIISIYSRNVVIRPFQKASGLFSLV